jgi:iron complex transport system ATP-binding protein
MKMTNGNPILKVEKLSVSLGGRSILEGVSLSVRPGEVVALIGPNGAGKTTLIRTASGAVQAESGSISVGGQPLDSLTPRELASWIAVVPQARNLPGNFTVWETVLFGRTPYIGWLGRTNGKDQAAVRQALEKTDSIELSQRKIGELSGGEQQRVLLARAFAQETPVLILDEPTAHLDLRHQSTLLNIVRRMAREHKKAVLIALHDLNLVALYADRTALLVEGRLAAIGKPAEILTPANLMQAYNVPVNITSHPVYGTPLVLPDGIHPQELPNRI